MDWSHPWSGVFVCAVYIAAAEAAIVTIAMLGIVVLGKHSTASATWIAVMALAQWAIGLGLIFGAFWNLGFWKGVGVLIVASVVLPIGQMISGLIVAGPIALAEKREVDRMMDDDVP